MAVGSTFRREVFRVNGLILNEDHESRNEELYCYHPESGTDSQYRSGIATGCLATGRDLLPRKSAIDFSSLHRYFVMECLHSVSNLTSVRERDAVLTLVRDAVLTKCKRILVGDAVPTKCRLLAGDAVLTKCKRILIGDGVLTKCKRILFGDAILTDNSPESRSGL